MLTALYNAGHYTCHVACDFEVNLRFLQRNLNHMRE